MDRQVSGLRPIAGRELRYTLTVILHEREAPLSIADLLAELASIGLTAAGDANKTVSDALRWEVGHGRVRRAGWGRYRPGSMPRSTLAWLRSHARRVQRGESVYAYELALRARRAERDR